MDYYYRSTAGGALKPLPSSGTPPDLAQVTTLTGSTVPYIVRIETGSINRAIYQIAMLHNPATEPAAGFRDSLRRMERQADLYVRRRMHGGLVSPGHVDRRR